jgi:acetyl esterase/lipase
MIEISQPTSGWPKPPAHGPFVPGRRIGVVVALVAALVVADGVALSASLHFPEVLLDPRSLAASLVVARPAAVVVSLIGLLASGVVLVALSGMLARALPENGGRPVLLVGRAAGLCWAIGGALSLVLVPMWAGNVASGVPLLAWLAFASYALAAPALSAVWIVLLSRRLRGARIIGALGTCGLLVTVARSAVWVFNAIAPRDEGWYLTSAVLTTLTLVGYPLWICWLVRVGLLLGNGGRAPGRPRHVLLTAGMRLAGALLASVFVLAYAITLVISTPTPDSDDVPAVPSAAGSVRYTVAVALAGQFAQPTSYQQLVAERQTDTYTRPEVPAGATRRDVDAGGVPAEYICAPGASADHVGLYLPGGGFILPADNVVRAFAATISRETRACVLMPHYRLAPEHPYPAALHDCVATYRWLRQQGTPAYRIAIFGDSAGGNLTLATAIALRDAGDALPAALVSVSGVTDFTMSGKAFRTKARGEVLITKPAQKYVQRSYAASAGNLRDPLLSPLYADLRGLPPTMLMTGSEEVLLSDAIRMADRLRAAGTPVRLEIWPGMMHSWISSRVSIMESRLAVHHLSTFISHHTS